MHRKFFIKRIGLMIGALLTLVLLTVSVLMSTQVKKIQEWWSQASPEPANIQVDTMAVQGQLSRPWRNLAQGGEYKEWRLTPLQAQIAQLHPEYIRIDHIYDFYDIVSGSPGNLSFDFSKLDPLLSDIQAVGAKPYIALSYTPPVISAGSIINEPVSYADWQLVVKKTIEHISGTRGIADVYYEVWNEPDLFGGWKYYGDKNYLQLYEASANGAVQAQGTRPFKIGGPATTALYKNWIDALLRYASDRNLRLDFVSWHRYSYELDQYRTDMRDIRGWMRQFPQYDGKIEYHITEWGHDSENNAGYDNNLGAAHTVAASIEMIGVIERAFVFEIQDGKDPQGQASWGRWGIFRHPDFGGQAKPRFQGLKLLDSLEGDRLQLLGKGTYVKAVATKDAQGKVSVVLANYDPSWKNVETVPVTFTNLADGTYTVTVTKLSGQQTKSTVMATGGTAATQVFLDKNEVVKISIQK